MLALVAVPEVVAVGPLLMATVNWSVLATRLATLATTVKVADGTTGIESVAQPTVGVLTAVQAAAVVLEG